MDGGVGRAAAHGEVVAADDHRPPVEPRPTEHEVGRRELDELAGVGVVGGPAGEGADLVEAARVAEGVDALAHGQLARGVLALDLVLPAHAPGERLAAAELLDLRLPRHGGAIPPAT